MEETGCCPRFDPKKWKKGTITWKNKPFVKAHVRSFMHIPLNMGKMVTGSLEKMKAAGAKNPDNIMLTDEKSMWGADIYIAVDREVPGAEMAHLSGTFLTKVFEGPYSKAGQWAREMEEFVRSKGKMLKKLYFSYTTCPRCAKAYGENYVVLFAQV
jgi:hypothetical protein